MAGVGSNPARIIPAWRDFVAAHGDTGAALRGIGEPIYPERSPAEMVECHRHEALLNIAFADTPPRSISSARTTRPPSTPSVVATARRTHPAVVEDGVAGDERAVRRARRRGRAVRRSAARRAADAAELEDRPGALRRVRRFVRGAAPPRALRPSARATCPGVNEVATNSVATAAGWAGCSSGRSPATWCARCATRAGSPQPLAGRERPRPGQVGGYGLWLANQLCDLVQVRAYAARRRGAPAHAPRLSLAAQSAAARTAACAAATRATGTRYGEQDT